ncbi:MAG: hypothetical protein H6735_15310 [Alphaproteobacteria bacterium]|nr:hypothetical protein [Alphaproteobacteria bacterium]
MMWFLEGGPTMWVILALDLALLLALGVGGVGALAARIARVGIWPARIVTLFVLMGAVVPVIVGVAGWWYGMMQVEAALQAASPDIVDTLRAVGEAEARVPLFFGGGSSGALAFPALIAAAIAWAPMRAAPEDDEDE